MFALVAYSLKLVKLLGTYKRTQHGWPTTHNVVTRPFARVVAEFVTVDCLNYE